VARKKNTVWELSVRNVGLRKTLKVMTFVMAWEMARQSWEKEHPGERFTIEEYGPWWKESRASAFREQALFRQSVGDRWATPTELLEEAARQKVSSWREVRWV
jgi:hypothetical protein